MIFELLKERRRRRLRARPIPKKWLTLIKRHVVFFHRLSASDRAELLGIQVFCRKTFRGMWRFLTAEVQDLSYAHGLHCCIVHGIFSGSAHDFVYPLIYTA
jgi:hypothetical protein